MKGGSAMSLLQVNDLTFCYEGSFDNIFENVSFSIDTNWKLGFVGRNGKGKTTFLNLLLGKYEYSGSISSDRYFDYFPYILNDEDMDKTISELSKKWKPDVMDWKIVCELNGMNTDPEILSLRFHDPVLDKCSAAAHPADDIFVLQTVQRLTDGLTADAVDLAKLLLG